MASTFSLTSDSYDGRYLKLTCSQKTDIATNKSTISWTLTSAGGEVNYYSTGPTTVTINGEQVYYQKRLEWDTETFPAAKGSKSGTITVDHDTYGKKKISVSLSTAIYYGSVGTKSDTWTLDDIPRNGTLSSYPSSFTSNGNPPTVYYSNTMGNNVSALEICIADYRAYNGYLPYRSVSKTGSFYTFTAADIEALKSIVGAADKELTVTFVLRTKIGETMFWSASSQVKFILVEDETTKPSVNMDVALNNGSLTSTFSDLYIQGKSRLDINLSTSGKYGASISSYNAKVEGKTYTSMPFTSDVFTTSGNVEVAGYAKDSRGFTRTVTEKVNVVPYSKPLVVPLGSENAIQCYRSDGNGVRVGKSTSVWVKAMRTFYSVEQKNGCALEWRSKLVSEGWNDSSHQWNVLIPKTASADTEYNALLSGASFDNKKSYTIQIRAIDDIGENDIKTFELPTEDVALHLGKGGKNVSVGSYCDYSEEHTFHSEWKGIFDDGIVGTFNHQYAADVIKFAEECAVGVTPFITGATSVNLPPEANYQYSAGLVNKRSESQITVYLTNYLSGVIATNTYFEGEGYGWTGWKYIIPQ